MMIEMIIIPDKNNHRVQWSSLLKPPYVEDKNHPALRIRCKHSPNHLLWKFVVEVYFDASRFVVSCRSSKSATLINLSKQFIERVDFEQKIQADNTEGFISSESTLETRKPDNVQGNKS